MNKPTHKEIMEHWLAGGVSERWNGSTARMHEDGSVRYDDGSGTTSFTGEWKLLPLSPWIEWNATEDSVCPVPEGTKGNVKLTDGEVLDDDYLDGYFWHKREIDTIVAYQVTYMPRPELGRKVVIEHNSGDETGPYDVHVYGVAYWSWSTYEQYTTDGTWRGWRYVTERRLMNRDEALEFIIDNPTMLVRRDGCQWQLPSTFLFSSSMEGYEYTLRDGNGNRTEPRRFEVDV